ncbi:MAG TPA: molybdate ABC transporter substrate-binding protein [Polyangiaceae bacterium]|jgi:molybdate transport system substrate-binding protein|nr:molybdate ABC transporter substrate-binding protein [Polyangiaceae bacterium]
MMLLIRAVLGVTALGAVLSGCSKAAPAETEVTIAAAADLTAAFDELGAAFAAKTGVHPTFTFGSTGLLAKQLEQGAPFDVFAAANVSYVDQAVQSGACDGATKSMYARGRLVLWWRNGATIAPPKALSDLADARFVHVSIANPEHAPYGRAAEEALGHAGVLDAVKPKLVFGENVQQAQKSAETGNADVAIVALSLAIHDEKGAYVSLDQSLHAPIDQAMVTCRHGHAAGLGKQFTDFIGSGAGRAVMRRYGFLLPGETLVAAP